MKIGILKFGKSLSFNPDKWGNIGGNNEVPMLIHALAHAYPQHEFWILSSSDFNKHAGLLPDNVKNAYDYAPGVKMSQDDVANIGKGDPEVDRRVKAWQSALSNIPVKLDTVIAYCGIVSTTNMMYTRPKADGSGYSKPLTMTALYCSPQVHFLQTNPDIPWINVITDPRQIINVKDWVANPPRREYAQIDKRIVYNPGSYVYGVDDVREFQWERTIKYFPVERVGLLSQRRSTRTPMDKDPGLTIVMHEGGGMNCEPRGPMLKSFVLDHVDDVEIYGKWGENWLRDPRFKGPVPYSQVAEKLDSRRYTFCVPIAPGWITLKAYEMITNGVIPFLHPSYASDVLNTDLPKALWVKDAADLKEKMRKLDENPRLLEALWNKCQQSLTKSMFTGQWQAALFCQMLNEACDVDLGPPEELNKHILDTIQEFREKDSLAQWF